MKTSYYKEVNSTKPALGDFRQAAEASSVEMGSHGAPNVTVMSDYDVGRKH